MTLKVTWMDSGKEPQCEPNPEFPAGKDVDIARIVDAPEKWPRCSSDLAYPAPRCGAYVVQCELCDANAVITTAGRVDDPRKVTLPCIPQSSEGKTIQ